MSTHAPAHGSLKAAILTAAVNLARTKSYREITALDVAQAAECAKASIFWHFETMGALRDAMVGYAVANKMWPILAEAIVAKHPQVAELPPDIKRIALLGLSK